LNAGIIDQHVKPAVLGQRRGDHFGDRLRPGHIGGGIADLDAEIGFDLVFGPGDLGSSPKPVQHHGRSGLGQRAGDPEANAAGRARHQRDLAGERPGGLCTGVLRLQLNVHDRSFLRWRLLAGMCGTGAAF
jgi:hypothetical protein